MQEHKNTAIPRDCGVFVYLLVYSAKVFDLAEVGEPFADDVAAVGLNDPQKITQNRGGDHRVVVAEEGFSAAGDLHLCPVCCGPALRNVDMDRLQEVVLIGPEVDDVGPDPKNLRH